MQKWTRQSFSAPELTPIKAIPQVPGSSSRSNASVAVLLQAELVIVTYNVVQFIPPRLRKFARPSYTYL